MIFAFDQSLLILQTTGWCLGYILFLTMEGAGLVTLGELFRCNVSSWWDIGVLSSTSDVMASLALFSVSLLSDLSECH